jgi:MULE transposase domain
LTFGQCIAAWPYL